MLAEESRLSFTEEVEPKTFFLFCLIVSQISRKWRKRRVARGFSPPFEKGGGGEADRGIGVFRCAGAKATPTRYAGAPFKKVAFKNP